MSTIFMPPNNSNDSKKYKTFGSIPWTNELQKLSYCRTKGITVDLLSEFLNKSYQTSKQILIELVEFGVLKRENTIATQYKFQFTIEFCKFLEKLEEVR